MQMNLDSVAVAPRLPALPPMKRSEYASTQIRRPAQKASIRIDSLDAWEKAVWISLAVSAIWALCLGLAT